MKIQRSMFKIECVIFSCTALLLVLFFVSYFLDISPTGHNYSDISKTYEMKDKFGEGMSDSLNFSTFILDKS